MRTFEVSSGATALRYATTSWYSSWESVIISLNSPPVKRSRTTRTVSSGSSYRTLGAFPRLALFSMLAHDAASRSRSACRSAASAPSAAVRTIRP